MLVNAAGVGHPGPVVEGRSEDWREMLEANLLALFEGCREAARAMTGRGGWIVNISSRVAGRITPGDAVYRATKHAVNAFTHALRAELRGSGVRVLLVEPAFTLTSFGRHLDPEQLRQLGHSLGLDPARIPDFRGGHAPPEFLRYAQEHLSGRVGSPEQVAEAVLLALRAPPGEEPDTLSLPQGRPDRAAGGRS